MFISQFLKADEIENVFQQALRELELRRLSAHIHELMGLPQTPSAAELAVTVATVLTSKQESAPAAEPAPVAEPAPTE